MTELAKHAIGDRIQYRYDAALIGTVADIVRPDEPYPMYGVRWDDEPERISRWYTWSMLEPIHE